MRRGYRSVFEGQAVLIFGAIGATLLGAVVALEFDRLIAVGGALMLPVGQKALIGAAITAGLVGFLGWVACALVTRTITRVALGPYRVLTDQLEGLVDGATGSGIDMDKAIPGVRRLARVVLTFHTLLIASQRSEAALQIRYDALSQANADERQSLMAIMTARPAATSAKALPPLGTGSLASGFDIPAHPIERHVAERPSDQIETVIDLTNHLGPLRITYPSTATSH